MQQMYRVWVRDTLEISSLIAQINSRQYRVSFVMDVFEAAARKATGPNAELHKRIAGVTVMAASTTSCSPSAISDSESDANSVNTFSR